MEGVGRERERFELLKKRKNFTNVITVLQKIQVAQKENKRVRQN